MTAKKPIQIDILGKRRFQRTYGNTYHTAEISILRNDRRELLHKAPRQYGYGDQYMQTAREWLAKNGYGEFETYPNGGQRYKPGNINISSRVLDVDRQKDL
jgi:hypothetical protein